MKVELSTNLQMSTDQTIDAKKNIIGGKDGRTILLSSELGAKLTTMKENMRTSSPPSNIHTVRSVLFGLVPYHVEKYEQNLDFEVTRVRLLYHCVKLFSPRSLTTSSPIIIRALWKEKHTQYLYDIFVLKVSRNLR